MIKHPKLLLQPMNKVFLLIVFTLFIVNQSKSQGMTEYEYYSKIYCNVVLNDVVKSIVNFEELNNYQLSNWKGLIEIDTICLIDKRNYRTGIARFYFSNTNYFLIYYVDCEKWKSTLLSYGYEGENNFNIKGWKKIVKLINHPITKDSIFYNNLEYLFLDNNIPSNYCIYKIENNSNLEKVNRFFSHTPSNYCLYKTDSTIKFHKRDNASYLLQQSSYPKIKFYVKVNISKNKLIFYNSQGKRIKRKIENHLRFIVHYLGPKIIFKPRKF